MTAFLEALPDPATPETPVDKWSSVPLPVDTQKYFSELLQAAHPGLQEVRFSGRRWHFFLSFAAQRRCQSLYQRSLIDEIMAAAGPLFRLAAMADLMEIALGRTLDARMAEVKDEDGRVLSSTDVKAVIEEAGGSGNIARQLARTYQTLSLGDLQTSGALMLYAGLSTFYPDLTLEYVEDRLGVDDFRHIQEVMLLEVQKAMDLREEMGEAAAPRTNGEASGEVAGGSTPEELNPGS